MVVLAACLVIVAGNVQAQPVGLEFYDNLSSLPYIYPNAESYYLSSYDRTDGNDDGFQGTYSQLYIDDKGEHVIFEEDGPGCVYNLWFTGSGRNLHWGKIHFKKSITISTEHGNHNNTPANYSSLVYYYYILN